MCVVFFLILERIRELSASFGIKEIKIVGGRKMLRITILYAFSFPFWSSVKMPLTTPSLIPPWPLFGGVLAAQQSLAPRA